jgi:hypothetical protein
MRKKKSNMSADENKKPILFSSNSDKALEVYRCI